MNVAFIPARCGSKGVPGKNIKQINGKPLIAWSIEHALSAECIDVVFVSTDCEEVRKVALDYGAEAPFLRPATISDDTASTESAVLHFLDWAQNNNQHFENLVLLQATSPLRYPGQIDLAMKQFIDENADSLVSVTKSHRFFWKTPEKPIASYDVFNRPRRQDIKKKDEVYFENGSFYITKKTIYKEFENRLGGRISMFNMSPEESFEIDDLFDFKLIEFLMKEYGV